MRYLITILILLGTFTLKAQAQGASSSGFIGMAGIHGGMGTMKDKDESIKSTTVLYTEALLQLGYHWGWFAPLIQAKYRYVGQLTDPDDVNGNNVGGMGYVGGLGFKMGARRYSFTAVYNLIGQYDLTKKSAGGSKVSYDKPTGFDVALGYQWKPRWELFLSFSTLDYAQRKTGSVKTDIKDDKLNQMLYGLGIGYLF